MATFYVDKRVAVNGNGSQASPFKRINEVCNKAIVGNNSTIEIVAGSGPYYYGTDDFGYLSQPNIYPNHGGIGTVTWNFNGNILSSEKQLIDISQYEWHESSGKPGMYYCSGLSGINPAITTVKAAIVDGYWLAESTNAFNTAKKYAPKSWGYGNYDSLGFNTVYISGLDPNDGQSHSVLISETTKPLVKIDSLSTPPTMIFNDVVFRGGGEYNVKGLGGCAAAIIFNRCRFENTDAFADFFVGKTYAITYNYCYFINSGHEAIAGTITGSNNPNKTANNCLFENSHTVTKLTSETLTNTITLKNCKTKNILAGCIQHNTASTQGFVESNNQWHVDPVRSVLHGGDIGISFAVAGRKWVTTAASDFPSSQATNTQVYASPESIPEGAGTTITGIHDQAVEAKDYNGDNVLFLPPNIGHIDGRKTKIISSTGYDAPTGYDVRSPAKLVITGGGNIDMSGLTDTGTIDVIATTGSTIKAFTGNGVNTSLRGAQGKTSSGFSKHLR